MLTPHRIHRQRRLLLLLALAALAAALPACVPERVAWSPDGSRAAVIAPDGLRLCDPSGKISEPLIPGQVQRAAWLPDGKHLALARTLSLPTWNDIEKLRTGATQGIADNAKTARAKLVASGGDEAALQDPDDPRADDRARLTAIYLRDNDPTLKKDLAANWDKLADLSYDIPVAELYDLSAPEPKKQATLFYAPLGWSLELRPSPTGAAVAITLWNAKTEIAYTAISATTFGPDDDVLFLGESCAYPDWSPDGKSLLFVQPPTRAASRNASPAHHGLTVPLPAAAKSADVRFGTLVRQTVIDTDGKLIEQHSKLPPEDDLAGLIYEPMGRVRAANDGRIFFTSRDVQLPATAADLPTTQSLFFIHPGKQATVSRAAPRSVEASLGNQLSLFELSPNAAHISVPSDHGQVSVLTLATGDVQRVQPLEDRTGGDWTLQSVPSWRSPSELTFVRPVKEGAAEREVVLHSLTDNTEKNLSATWPAPARDGWLTPSSP
jgi:hypothetical protein